MNKNDLRNKYIGIRTNVNKKDLKSKIINEKIINFDLFKNSKVISLYSSLECEVNTDLLINYGIKNKKTIALPRVIDKNHMEFFKINSQDKLLDTGAFGIKEPLNKKDNLINKNLIDLIIVPGICFDKDKNRIGFGKGYYDRYLSDISINTTKLGICFNEQLLTDSYIESSETDIKMDIIITNKNIIK